MTTKKENTIQLKSGLSPATLVSSFHVVPREKHRCNLSTSVDIGGIGLSKRKAPGAHPPLILSRDTQKRTCPHHEVEACSICLLSLSAPLTTIIVTIVDLVPVRRGAKVLQEIMNAIFHQSHRRESVEK